MRYRALGRTGVQVSSLCLGTGNFGDMIDEPTARELMSMAIEEGINVIDTADSYSAGESERIVGRFLKDANLRNDIFLITKVYYPTGGGINDRGLSRYHVLRACEASLRRLQTDRIDLYLLHRSANLAVPIDETLETLNDLVRQGKVCYIGSSTFPAWQVMEALATSERRGYSRFVAESPPYNLLDRRAENELIPLCRSYGLGVFPWSPLAMGMLAGRYQEDRSYPEGSRAAANPRGIYAERINKAGIRVGHRVAELARDYGLTAGQLALLWLKDQPGVTSPIIGPRDTHQLREMLGIVERNSDDRIRAYFDSLVPPGLAVANFHNTSGWMAGWWPDEE